MLNFWVKVGVHLYLLYLGEFFQIFFDFKLCLHGISC